MLTGAAAPAVPGHDVHLRVRASLLVLVALVWSWQVQSVLLPVPLPSLLRGLVFSALILAAAYAYREYRLEWSLTRRDLAVLAAYVAMTLALNWWMLSEALTGDELYHADKSVVHLTIFRSLPASWKTWRVFQSVSVKELNAYASLALLLALAALLPASWRRFRRATPRGRQLAVTIAVVVCGVVFSLRPVPVESHPPLRLLPLFASQLVFGLNDAAFRLPGLLAAALVCFAVYRVLEAERPDASRTFLFFVPLAVYMIPTVFHAAAIVEPSIWAFCTWMLAILCLHLAFTRRDPQMLVWAGLIVGLGALCRQTVIALWPIVALLGLIGPCRLRAREWILACAPALFVVPYLYTIERVGHPAVDSTRSPVANLVDSIASGAGPAQIVTSTTPPWMVLLVAGAVIAIWLGRANALRHREGGGRPLRWFYLAIVPAYALYHIITPALWPLGRYQAEYIAPLVALTILLLAFDLPRARHAVFLSVLALLSIYSWRANVTIPEDVRYAAWPEKRISTESSFPYKDALGFLERQDTGGRLLILGGVPTYGDMILTLRGFTFPELETSRAAALAFGRLAGRPIALQEFERFLDDRRIDFLVVQYGDKRETQHREPWLQTLMGDVERGPFLFTRQYTFVGRREGAIDIYTRSRSRY